MHYFCWRNPKAVKPKKRMTEKTGTYHYVVEPFTEDCRGCLSWGNLGNLLLRCATLHATEHGFGYKQMIARHHAWVLSRLVVDLEAMPRTGERFDICTWVEKLYRQFTDRHFSILRPDGTAYGHASSTWALIDTTTRLPADLSLLPDGGFTDLLMPERPAPTTPMKRIRLRQPQATHHHLAAYTDLDINGHVNSVRYIELLLNCFPAHTLEGNAPRRIEVAYCMEAYDGDRLCILQEPDPKYPARQLFEIHKQGGDGTDEVAVKASITLSNISKP